MSQANLHTRIETALREYHLCAPGDCLIVAVSGGADSVALLDLLASTTCYSFRLIVAHLNHLLRKEASNSDEQFVKALAERYGLPCEVARVEVNKLAQTQRLSLEEAGRLARYAFFEKLRQRHHAVAVAVAHHADDQAETLLLRLLRGAGTAGLASMTHGTAATVIRPLLGVRREELRNHLAQRNIPFHDDASNLDRSFLRNRVRHELLPLLSRYNPAITERLTATATLLHDDEQLLEQITRQVWQQLATKGAGWVALPRGPLQEQATGMRLRLYRTAIVEVAGDLRKIERKHCQAIDHLLQGGQTGARVALPKGLTAVITSDHLLLARRTLLQPRIPISTTINGPGCYQLGNGLQLLVEPAAAPAAWQELPPYVSYVDNRQAPFPWELRPARPDDRLELLGMTGSRLVRDILVDTKLPRHLRPSLPLLLHNGRPLWLPPLRRTRLALMPHGQPSGIRLTLLGRDQLPLFP